MTRRGFLLATLFCCGFFGISVTLDVILRVNIPSLWNRLYTGVYSGVVWLPDSPEEVQKRFIETEELVEISLFGITNLDDVRSGRGKPIMERIGPYVFQKKRRRTNVTWTDGGEQVVFLQGDTYTFVESMSVGNLDDTVVTLNIPLVGVLEMILSEYSSGKLSAMLQLVAHMVESWGDERVSGVFMTRSVGELLFGYSDPLLSILSQFIPGIKSEFYLLDSQSEQSFTMRTGKRTLEELGEIIRWQGVDEIRSWKEPEVVQGTDGRQFSPSIEESLGQMVDPYNGTRRVWVTEAFRSFEMVPSRGYGIGGVQVVRIMPSETAFNASENYYQEYDGLMNITRPLHAGVDGDSLGAGPRLFLSLPGFCKVDSAVASTVEGVLCTNDDENPHIFLDIEVTTGITVNARKSFMLSSWFGALYRYIEPGINREAFIPVMEITESSMADGHSLSELARLQTGVRLSQVFLQHYLEGIHHRKYSVDILSNWLERLSKPNLSERTRTYICD